MCNICNTRWNHRLNNLSPLKSMLFNSRHHHFFLIFFSCGLLDGWICIGDANFTHYSLLKMLLWTQPKPSTSPDWLTDWVTMIVSLSAHLLNRMVRAKFLFTLTLKTDSLQSALLFFLLLSFTFLRQIHFNIKLIINPGYIFMTFSHQQKCMKSLEGQQVNRDIRLIIEWYVHFYGSLFEFLSFYGTKEKIILNKN